MTVHKIRGVKFCLLRHKSVGNQIAIFLFKEKDDRKFILLRDKYELNFHPKIYLDD